MAVMSLAAARALLSRIAVLEAETSTDMPFALLQDDPEWILIPPARREVALTRHKVLSAYDRKKSPTKSNAQDAASVLGLQLRSFYALVRTWRDKGKSPFELVPYAGDRAPRASRLEAPVATHLTAQVDKLLAVDPTVAPGKAVRAIKDGWPDTLKRPSDVTIRAFVDRRKAESPAEPGSLRLDYGGNSEPESAERFGEVIVIDHTSPVRLLLDGDSASVPTITLAIDLFTGVPIGAAVCEGEPGPDAVIDALADARERMEEIGAPDRISPRIVYASTRDPEWRRLHDELVASGLAVAEKPDHRLNFGGSIKRLLGERLGPIALQASKAGNVVGDRVDPDQDALLDFNQMLLVVDSAVDDMIDERLPEIDGLRGAMLDLPDWLTSRRGMGSRIMPLITLGASNRRPYGWEQSPGPHAVDSRTSVPAFDPSFAADLHDIVDEILAPVLSDVVVNEPAEGLPGWAVKVVLNDGRHLAEAWLRLAHEALEIAETEGELVRFDVSVAAAGKGDVTVADAAEQGGQGASPRTAEHARGDDG